MEKKGIPSVLETFDDEGIKGIATESFMQQGIPEIRQVFTPPDTSLTSLTKYMPQFIDALTKPLTDKEKKSGIYSPPRPPRIAMTGSYNAVQKYFEGKLRRTPHGGPWAEMTDGLPVTPPTEEAVAEMLKGSSHSPDEIIEFGGWMSGKHIATVEKVAVNAVMAGCKPDYFPVVLAIAETGACVGYPGDSSFGHMFVVSGPIAREIGMNSGFSFLTPGNPANTSLQRACTLMGINLGKCRHGINCLERTGTMYWGTIFAENEESPWELLNEHFGYKTEESILMAWGGKIQLNPFQNIEVKSVETLKDNQPGSPEHALAALSTITNENGALVLFTPDTARLWVKEYGFKTMKQLQDYVWDNVTRTRGEWVRNYWFWSHHRDVGIRQRERGSRMLNSDHLDLPDDALVPMFNSPEDITIIVAGGSGDAWTWGGSFGKPRIYSIDKWR